MRRKNVKRQIGRQSRQVAEKTKNQILEAALEVFAREGFFNAKLRDIAKSAGITHSLIRHHFGSKDDLWKAVVVYGLQMHEDRLKQIINSQGSMDAVELYKKCIAAHISLVAEKPDLTKVLLHNNSRSNLHLDYIAEKQRGIYKLTEPFFNRAQDCGYFKDFDHESFTVYMRAIADTPIATRELTNKVFKVDIRSEKGIALHTRRVINFLFRKDD